MRRMRKRQIFAIACLSSMVLFLAYFVQLRLLLGLILYLMVILFYRGLEFTDSREIEYDYKKTKMNLKGEKYVE